jgi:integrase
MASKPRPAPVYDKIKNSYRLYFCYNGKAYFGPYQIKQHLAYLMQAKVNELVTQFKLGFLPLPSNISLPDYIFSHAVSKPDPATIPTDTVSTLEDLVHKYQQMSAPPIKNPSTCRTEKIHLIHLQRFLQQQNLDNLPLPEINVGFFQNYKQFRYSQGIRTDTVKKELGTFQCMFQVAVDHGYVPHNVVRDVKRDKSQVPCDRFRTHTEIEKLIADHHLSDKEIREVRRFRYLTPEEVDEILTLAQGHRLYPVLATFAYTAMRRGELVRLQWSDVDLERRQLYVHSYKQSQTKQETVRRVSINKKLLPVLQEQKQKTGHQQWVFLDEDGNKFKEEILSKRFRRFIKGTKFQGVGFHVFRHSLSSNMASKAVDQRTIDQIMGHQTEAMRQRYQHLFPEQMEAAVNKVY